MNVENLEYVGGGYFREKTQDRVGVSRPIYHAPELFKELISKINKLKQNEETNPST